MGPHVAAQRRAPATEYSSGLLKSSGFRAQPNSRGAVVGEVLRAKAPNDVVIQLRPVDRHLPLVVVAEAAVAYVLTAAVAVRNDVLLAVGRMLARPPPRGRRR